MVRKRGVARTSFARRRVRRVKKYDHNVIPKRFKILLPDIADRWKPPTETHVECEEPTMLLLASLGVPQDEWQYYLGYMKRMLELYKKFSSASLQLEKDSLISEYVLRGKDKSVLEEVQEVAANCSEGIFELPLNCADVKACLEGDYSSWSKMWEWDFIDGLDSVYEVSIAIAPTFLNIWYYDGSSWMRVAAINISDSSTISITTAGTDYTNRYPNLSKDYAHKYDVLVSDYGASFSILAKYVVYILNGKTKFSVWKDGVEVWVSPLASIVVVGASNFAAVGISSDGKYVIAVTDTKKLVCFEGS